MELNQRQEKILKIVKQHGPITGSKIAEQLSLTRATLRPDLAILTMSGYLDARPRVGYFYTGKESEEVMTSKIRNILVSEVQSVPILIKEDTSIYEAVVKMFLEDVGTLYAIDNNKALAGVISRKDLLRGTMGGNDIEKTPVSVIMTRKPNITICYPNDLLIYAANQLIEKQIDSLPVVEERDGIDQVIGRITKTTITRVFVNLME
ncbi:helix-turn-helix transcriptional regulator [Salinicoccus roseus]|mgnify:CR=1 FL=1|jgi:CBS domain-containing protein|uniref:Transcriptional repressor CcpN n=1 Tax=Salinicoccus roseus TaxID=45670 RepID=A0A265E982_9STAP|nr:helix-turn-helix transcriptional regulator [Salinicoccus roseus]MBY8908688.1 helix-turn-helix transcriptional regulator [Salinicoccus roseus]MCG7332814.1 helix-turn-helix transcriptional regulator [Salinicoccus roseus]OZT78137.1 transcriptional repressor CcpN [Salinicoccus roseus]